MSSRSIDESEYEAWDGRLSSANALTEASWFAASDFDRERFRRFPSCVAGSSERSGPAAGCAEDEYRFRGSIRAQSGDDRDLSEALEREFPGQYVIFGHIGDAHVHVNILPDSGEEAERAKALIIEFARQAVRLGGTVSAEHGLGKRKAHLLAMQYTPEKSRRCAQ